jgi:hypothetical protein
MDEYRVIVRRPEQVITETEVTVSAGSYTEAINLATNQTQDKEYPASAWHEYHHGYGGVLIFDIIKLKPKEPSVSEKEFTNASRKDT